MNKIQFDWHLESGVASLGNLILFLLALFSFPFILHSTNALALMGMDPSSPQHKAAVMRFCVVVTAYLWVLFCIALGGLGTTSRCTYADVIGRGWTDTFSGLGISAVVLAAIYAIGQLSTRLITPGQPDAAALRWMVPQRIEEALAFLIVGLSAGFVEEFVFRGYLQKQLQALFGNTLVASVVQVALYTQGHLYQGMARLVPVALIGALLTFVALWRKSLIPGMIAHGVGDSLTAIVYLVTRM